MFEHITLDIILLLMLYAEAAEADDEADDDALDGDGGRPQPAEGLSIQAKQLASLQSNKE